METQIENSMETTKSTSKGGGLTLMVLSILLPLLMKAQESGRTKTLGSSISKDEVNSLYIVGSVLVLGIVGYIVYSFIEKHRKQEKPTVNRHVSHRNHHHHNHRVVKKSA